MRNKTAGRQFDPQARHLYFAAGNMNRLQNIAGIHHSILIAVNELNQNYAKEVEGWIRNGVRVLVDSGIFALAADHAFRHHMPLNDVLKLGPEKVDGFKELYEEYLGFVKHLGEDSWGYIELDLGSHVQKTAMREKLESLGLRPIPVYHPKGDPPEYFDFLATHYDRVCVGNLARSAPLERREIVATMYRRHCKFPDVWIHLLGTTANEWLYAMPPNSTDSSTWLNAVRFGAGHFNRIAGKTFGQLPYDYVHALQPYATPETGPAKSCEVAGFLSNLDSRNWLNFLDDQRKLGVDIYPQVLGI